MTTSLAARWALVALPLSVALFGEGPLRNEDIIALAKAGLSSGVMLEKVRSSSCAFDVSVEGLIALKSGKVPDDVIQAMVSSECAETAGEAIRSAPAQASAEQPGVKRSFAQEPRNAPRESRSAPLRLMSHGAEPRFLLALEPPEGRVERFHLRSGVWSGQGACPSPETLRTATVLGFDVSGKSLTKRTETVDIARTELEGEFSIGALASGGFKRLSPVGKLAGYTLLTRFGRQIDSTIHLTMEGEKDPQSSGLEQAFQMIETPDVPVGVGARWELPVPGISADSLKANLLKQAPGLIAADDLEAIGRAVQVVEVKKIGPSKATLDVTYSIDLRVESPDHGAMQIRGAGHIVREWNRGKLFPAGMSGSIWFEQVESAGGSGSVKNCTVGVTSSL